MKNEIIMTVILVMLDTCCRAQELSPLKVNTDPIPVEVTFLKTTHLLFPSAIRYVDLGSAAIIADRVPTADNVLRIKATVKDFTEETNFTVMTDDGTFYQFDVTYADEPNRLVIEIEKPLPPDKSPDTDTTKSFQSESTGAA